MSFFSIFFLLSLFGIDFFVFLRCQSGFTVRYNCRGGFLFRASPSYWQSYIINFDFFTLVYYYINMQNALVASHFNYMLFVPVNIMK